MGNSIGYKYEKLLKARYSLAVSRKSIRDRIDESYHQFWLLKEEDFDESGKVIRCKIQQLLTKNEAPEGSVIPHNIKHMPLARAEEIAALILELYDIVAREYSKQR
ncbi:hypothetical protein PVB89_004505 [Vibrio parahaemolyticus]|nr:hypothetical protein [Vibrio parahaemolyticus]EHK9073605.1 hypothetical protein [Vibrio parahaemolyticus]EIY6182621.1 hypothetical protein [Vibrio parahaemolyticus]EIZ1178931.1 hypothetical protein [Vibrio parahaemolyticus]EJG1101367.1 hypothetical protein [Vibrio parahaemolyticus]